MPDARFLQIHSLHGYPAALLNRDESGLAKRMTYGGSIRTRISSQCLKRHWRTAEGAHALHGIKGATAAVRSRDIVTRRIIEPLASSGHDPAVIEALEPSFQTVVYGDKGTTRGSRQPLLLGEPEIEYLAAEATRLAVESGNDAKAAEKAVAMWQKSERANLKALGDATRLPAGLAAALFGRMVTSDPEANLDAAVHVAHAFTVHEEESESDYFSVVDDLKRDDEDAGAAHINETELTAGLFYGYVVLDRGMLLRNLGGDTDMAGAIAERLAHLIATVSPGAKLGSTAPYSYASWMLVEAGERQPRSLAEAFRKECRASTREAEEAVCGHLESLDRMYGAQESRRLASLSGIEMPGAEGLSLKELAEWAGAAIETGTT